MVKVSTQESNIKQQNEAVCNKHTEYPRSHFTEIMLTMQENIILFTIYHLQKVKMRTHADATISDKTKG
jgi:hypothetical protein